MQPSFQTSLNDVAQTLQAYPSTAVDVIGHASSDGDDASNQALSEQRARSVRNYLISTGMEQVRINAIGMGETQPVADNA
ncbi:MAG: OmpA family protein, partial [Henriciella sp.]|nr:OmpA family protein [Henriciella sp.]